MDFILVGFGGIVGSLTRFFLSKWVGNIAKSSFPFGTFIINITGSFILGFSLLFFHRHENDLYHHIHLFFDVGFLGSYTTFSTFSYETIALMNNGERSKAAAYLFGSILFGLIGATIGIGLYHVIFGRY